MDYEDVNPIFRSQMQSRINNFLILNGFYDGLEIFVAQALTASHPYSKAALRDFELFYPFGSQFSAPTLKSCLLLRNVYIFSLLSGKSPGKLAQA